MFEIIVLILLIAVIVFMGYVIYLMSEQIEQFEDVVQDYTDWIENFVEQISIADQKMKAVDNRGSFSSDDEIGFAYQTVKECINQLTEMGVITYERQEDGQTDSSEEVQGQEEEE